jgi:hypothetical protein
MWLDINLVHLEVWHTVTVPVQCVLLDPGAGRKDSGVVAPCGTTGDCV